MSVKRTPSKSTRSGNPHQIASRRMKPSILWIIVAISALFILGKAILLEREPRFYPYVIFQATEALQITFLQRVHGTRSECEATVNRMTKAMGAYCSTCRLLENRCLDKLNPRQHKILAGQPIDIPVMRMLSGTVAFIANSPELALQVCQETGRQTARNLPGETQCTSASTDSLGLSVATVARNTDTAPIPKLHALLSVTLLATIISFVFCYLIKYFDWLHSRFSSDHINSGPQKFHATPTPRIGGLALVAALAGSILILRATEWLRLASAYGLSMLALAAIPAFAGGFVEDITKRVNVPARLMLTIAAGVIAALLVGATLDRVDVPGFDTLLQWPVFAVVFTAFAVGGMANAINIIDGYNGLVGGYAVLVLAALSWVSVQVGDPVVLTASLGMLGALLGFLVWNYPKGRIFLGDGGAYLLGFWLAELSVLLVVRNPDVSPWFPMLLLAYPAFETLFSIYRRKFLHGDSPGRPDALHFHQLIYMRLARVAVGSKNAKEITYRNNMVAPYIWAGSALFILPSLFFWRNTPALISLTLVFCVAYMWLYLRLVRWNAPTWLINSSKRPSVLKQKFIER